MAARPPEAKAAANFIKALSVIDFDFGVFAVVLAQSKPVIQKRILMLFTDYIDALAYRYSENARYMDEEETALCLRAVKIQNALTK